MTDDPKEKPKTNGQDEDDDERKEEPWPDDNVPRPPFMPPPDQPRPDVRGRKFATSPRLFPGGVRLSPG